MKIAVIFHRLGPYHHSRLNAVGRIEDVFGIEACAVDDTYAWEKLEGADHFTRVTLQEHDPNGRQDKQKLRSCMFRVLDEIQPTAVAIPGWSFLYALCGLAWCADRKIPAVIMSDSTRDNRSRWAWREAIKRQLVQLVSSALVAGTPHKDYLVQLGVPANRVFLGYDAVDNEYFARVATAAKHNSAELRQKHGLPEKYFLVPARFIWEKNLPSLIVAYARYRQEAEGRLKQSGCVNQNSEIWNLVLLGDGSLRPVLECLIANHSLQNCVRMSGFIQYSDLPAFYGLASAMILPSISETWGLVVNEAMAVGLPVLVSNRCGCAADLVKDGVNGFTFDPLDVEQLAQLMLKISVTDFPISTFGLASQRIISEWGPERFAVGLKAAADCALAVGPAKPTLLQRLILKVMLTR